ncbi:MAG: bifunctional oligoribonuclease/PAP phosphatase NrnA [Mycoplasmataceae bacterium]|nr:bifunctional oligoribonuclease/PAP phosphatase NrnA [Mycoplasmataceae bacterium]
MYYLEIQKIIKKYSSIIIFHHVNPDGDCLGTQFGLKELIQDNFPDKKVYVIGDSNNILSFLDFEHDLVPNENILRESLGIVVDANFTNRIKNSELITQKKIKNIIRIDHHIEDDDLEPLYSWVDPSYCASAEQVAQLAIKLKWKISKKAAAYIYLGIYTDSGRFFYDKTSARTFNLVSELLKTKFDVQYIHNNLSKRNKEEIIFQKEVLNNYKTEGNTIYYYLSNKKSKKLNISDNNRNRVDFLANISPYTIWIFFIEQDNGEIRVRLRSSIHDIHQIAIQYGGGGHEKASGATIKNKKQIAEVVNKASIISS